MPEFVDYLLAKNTTDTFEQVSDIMKIELYTFKLATCP